MYFVKKTLEISSCHQLYLDYESKCENLHGHNWMINIYCKSKELDSNGMVTDFTQIKKMIHGHIDQAENIARWIVDTVPNCYRAEVWESRDNMAAYERDE